MGASPAIRVGLVPALSLSFLLARPPSLRYSFVHLSCLSKRDLHITACGAIIAARLFRHVSCIGDGSVTNPIWMRTLNGLGLLIFRIYPKTNFFFPRSLWLSLFLPVFCLSYSLGYKTFFLVFGSASLCAIHFLPLSACKFLILPFI